MFKQLICVTLILAAAMPTFAQQKPCNKTDRDQVEKEASTLRTWDALYLSYRRFRNCKDDVDAQEGYSESKARILADHWDSLPRLAYLIKKDQKFGGFVGLDATMSMDDVRKIKENATHHCPRSLSALCTKLKMDAASAIAEDAAAHEQK
jgi:poly(A) polymerase Pap1